MVLRFFPIFLSSCLQLSGSLVLYIQGNETSFDFLVGVTSEIQLYVNDENHDGKEVRIFVSHQPEDTKRWDTKCILTQSATGCNTTSDICFCPAHNSSRNVFSLKKSFLQSDTGVWRFQSFSHCNESKIVKVKVHASTVPIQNNTSLQPHESTEASLMTSSTPSSQSNTRSIAAIIVTVLVIIIAITAVVVLWCRYRILTKITQRILRGGARQSNPLTHISSGEVNEYTTPGEVQQSLCEDQSLGSTLPPTGPSADQPDASSVHGLQRSEMLRDSLMKVTTIDFIKSNGTTGIHLVTMATPAQAPPAP